MFTATPLTEKGDYFGYTTRLGSNSRHWFKRPKLLKDPVIAFVGASVPKQIADKVIELNNTNVKIVNLCVPARDINRWIDPADGVWSNANSVLAANGLTWEDVNVVWTMQDDLRDNGDARFPEAPESLKLKLNDFFMTLQIKFPNIAILDLASRTYNYGTAAKHAEPSCYHTGWANKWFVEDHRRYKVYCTDRCYLWLPAETMESHYVEDLVHYSAEGEDYWGNKVYEYYGNYEWFK
jgi:hypothetical protein